MIVGTGFSGMVYRRARPVQGCTMVCMDRLPSSVFRKRYSALTEPVEVTVNGHVIGEWVPVKHSRYVTVQEAKAVIADVRRDVETVAAERFNSRPFTPVPKKGK
jgi:hypothetical protein